MSTSGTYAYAPNVAEFIDEGFERCDPELVLQNRHLVSARRSMMLMFTEWENKGVDLFAVDEQTQTLTQSLDHYTAAAGTLMILDGRIARGTLYTPVFAMDMEAYHAIPDKTEEGLTSQVWHNRATGIYYLFQVPENSTDVFRYFRLRQKQDILTSAETPDVGRRWNEALAAGLAAKLAVKWAPQKADSLEVRADKAFAIARMGDREYTGTSFTLACP